MLEEDEEYKWLSLYLLELTMPDYRMIKYSPSHIAASVVFLCNKYLQFFKVWCEYPLFDGQLGLKEV